MAGNFLGIDRGAAGAMGAYYTSPAHPIGSLIVVQEIFGVTQAMREIADDLASSGYAVLVPDLFWRIEPRVELGDGEDAAGREKAIKMLSLFDVELGVSDLAAAGDFLRGANIGDGHVGLVGFCIGGRMAALVAAAGSVTCASAFYGVGLDKYLDRIAAINVPVQFHFGDQDTHIPRDAIQSVERAIKAAPSRDAVVHMYADAGHAFFNKHRTDSFNPAAYAKSKTALLGFLRTYIGKPAQTEL